MAKPIYGHVSHLAHAEPSILIGGAIDDQSARHISDLNKDIRCCKSGCKIQILTSFVYKKSSDTMICEQRK